MVFIKLDDLRDFFDISFSGEPRGCTSCSRVCRNRGSPLFSPVPAQPASLNSPVPAQPASDNLEKILSKIETLDDKIKKLTDITDIAYE